MAEELEIDDADMDEELERLATQYQTDVDDIRQQLEHGDGLAPIRSELLKRKALEWLVDEVQLVDEDGTAIDRADLELPAAETTDSEEGDSAPAEPSEEDDE